MPQIKSPSSLSLSCMGVLLALLALAGAGCNSSGAGGPTATTSAVAPTPSAYSTPSATTAANPSPTKWVPPTALAGTPILGAPATLTAAPKLQTETITLVTGAGEQSRMMVEIAADEPSRELGLMFRPSVDPDAGMLFDFGEDTTSEFWMQNTILPLSIAFIQADGLIVGVADMQPLDTTSIGPGQPYRYALETNQGYFRAHGLQKGDHVILPGSTSPTPAVTTAPTAGPSAAIIPGMPDCSRP